MITLRTADEVLADIGVHLPKTLDYYKRSTDVFTNEELTEAIHLLIEKNEELEQRLRVATIILERFDKRLNYIAEERARKQTGMGGVIANLHK